ARRVQLAQELLLLEIDDRIAHDDRGTELDHVAVLQRVTLDALAVHEGAVGALQIFEHIPAATRGDLRVAAADAAVVEPHVAVLLAPDAHHALLQAHDLTELRAVNA